MAPIDSCLAEFAELVGAEGPVSVEGGRTRWATGGPLADGARVVRAPLGVVSYQPEEMTVRVRAGTPVADLHAALAASGQRTALPERGGTVGGAVVVGENDHRVLGRGRVRNALLQVHYVSGEGRLVSGGGPTVKNVTGFDLPRMIVGSLGTLGLVAEVILRTNPIPPVSVWLCSSDADPFEARDRLLAPSAVLWDGSSTWVQIEGHGADVRSQAALLDGAGRFEEVAGPPPMAGRRWSMRPSELRTLRRPDVASAAAPFVASVGVGTVFTDRPRPATPVPAAIATLSMRLKQTFDPTGRLNPGRTPGSNP